MLSFAHFFSVNNCDFSVLRTPEIASAIRFPDFRPSCSCLFSVNNYDFSVLRTPEIASAIRFPDFRPSCSCLFARQIITQLCLLAGMLCNCLPGLFTHYITCFGALYTGQTASIAHFLLFFILSNKTLAFFRINIYTSTGIEIHTFEYGFSFGAWLSLVERFVRDEEVAGSNPVAPIFYALFYAQL